MRVEVRRADIGFVMSAQAVVDASIGTAWRTMTDYEHLPQFIPGLRSAQVVERHGGAADEDLVVEERGDAHFLMFGQSFRIRMDVHQAAPHEISAHGVPWTAPAGPNEVEPKAFEARYELEPTPAGVRIVYSARIVPAASWPATLERIALRQTASRQFGALIAEILRRERDARSTVQ